MKNLLRSSLISASAIGSLMAVSASSVFAQETTPTPVDLSSLADAVDFSSVTATVLAIAGTVFGVLVLMKGITFVRRALG